MLSALGSIFISLVSALASQGKNAQSPAYNLPICSEFISIVKYWAAFVEVFFKYTLWEPLAYWSPSKSVYWACPDASFFLPKPVVAVNPVDVPAAVNVAVVDNDIASVS